MSSVMVTMAMGVRVGRGVHNDRGHAIVQSLG